MKLTKAKIFFLFCAIGFAKPLAAEAPNRLLLANCLVITLVKGQEKPFLGYIVVDSAGKISAIGKGNPPADIGATLVFDAGGQVAMPGFLSGHSHLRGSVSRGLAANSWVTEWGRVTGYLSSGDQLAPNDLYYYTLHGALDMLRGGVTTVYNYTTGGGRYSFEQLQAEFDAGGHFVYGYSAPVHEPGMTLERAEANVRTYLDLVKKNPRRDLLLRSSFGSIAMRWTENETRMEFELLKAFPEFEKDIQLHYLEPPPTVPRTIYERSNFIWLKKYGILGPNLTYAHFVHPTEEILQESVAAHATMIWNPLSNGRLASGLSDIPRYLQLGMTVGMGLDGQASSDLADPFENMRVGLYGLRFRDESPHGLQPIEMLRLHTIGTAKAIRVADKVGTLELGKFGDIILVDPHWPDTGVVADIYATLVLACDRMNISNVFVAGNHVMAHGKHASIDVNAVTQEVLRRVATKSGNPG